MKTLALFLALFTFGIQTGFAQQIAEQKAESKAKEKEIFLNKKNTISVSPFNIMFKQMQFSYERRFGNKNSFMLVSSILHHRDAAYNSINGYNFGLSAELHYRKYIYNTKLREKKNPKSQNVFGIYVAPFAGYQYLERDIQITHYDESTSSYFFGAEQSYQNAVQLGLVSGINVNLLKGRLSLDLYAGFAEKLSFVGTPYSNLMNYPYYYYSPGIFQFDVFGIIPKANMQVGFSF